MKDHLYIDRRGRLIPVARMRSRDIIAILAEGPAVIDMVPDGGNSTSSDIIERLRIELVARSLPVQ